jgi:hypothetical protein
MNQRLDDFFLGRVDNYTDWKYPGLQLNPGLGDVTEKLVDLDPLYLADEHRRHVQRS